MGESLRESEGAMNQEEGEDAKTEQAAFKALLSSH